MENEIPSVNRVDEIKDRLRDLEGQRVKVRANMGRSRIVERAGTLVHVHPARQSYQYVDILTGTVELFDIDSGERLFDYVAEEQQ